MTFLAIMGILGLILIVAGIGAVFLVSFWVGLGLIISVYRHYRTTNLDRVDSMRG